MLFNFTEKLHTHDATLEQVNTLNSEGENVRVYQVNGQTKWPSVNKVLDYVEDKSFLYEWKARVGAEEAARISQKASVDGSAVHRANEAFFTGDEVELKETRQKQIAAQFQKFLKHVKYAVGHEKKTYWEGYLTPSGEKVENGAAGHLLCGSGGTFDAVLSVDITAFEDGSFSFLDGDSAVFLVDYKTQSKQKKVEWMIRHYLQLAAYMGAINQRTNCEFNLSHALIVGATSRSLYIYNLDSRIMNWYWRCWLQMLAAYFYETPYDWNGFKQVSCGYELVNDQWEFIGLPDAYLPKKIYLKSEGDV